MKQGAKASETDEAARTHGGSARLERKCVEPVLFFNYDPMRDADAHNSS